jgi:hypothetical protein
MCHADRARPRHIVRVAGVHHAHEYGWALPFHERPGCVETRTVFTLVDFRSSCTGSFVYFRLAPTRENLSPRHLSATGIRVRVLPSAAHPAHLAYLDLFLRGGERRELTLALVF